MGTLLELVPPVPIVERLLAAGGHPQRPEVIAAALAAEIRHYRAHLQRGHDPAGLEALRRECAEVLLAGLEDPRPSAERAYRVLLEGLRFRLFADVVPALEALAHAGVRVGVVSDWDCSLEGVLGDLEIRDAFQVVVSSAVVGARKPDPRPFRALAAGLGVEPSRVLHCGDDPALDCVGAERAGMRAVTISRGPRPAPAECPQVRDLAALVDLVLGRRRPP